MGDNENYSLKYKIDCLLFNIKLTVYHYYIQLIVQVNTALKNCSWKRKQKQKRQKDVVKFPIELANMLYGKDLYQQITNSLLSIKSPITSREITY